MVIADLLRSQLQLNVKGLHGLRQRNHVAVPIALLHISYNIDFAWLLFLSPIL